MKIAIISPNPGHLDRLAAPLREARHEVACFEGGKSRMREVADHERPQVVLVDGMCCDPADLALVEEATLAHPALAVVLLCATHTPEFLLQAMRAGVREVLPSPPAPAALLAAVQRLQAKAAGAAPATGKVVAFTPCKGGAGATFLATNVAWQLAASRSVLLVDLNLQFGNALAFVHDGRPAFTIADLARDIGRLDASLLSSATVRPSPGLAVLAAPEDPGQAVDVLPAHVDAILGLAASRYDFVVLDLPRSLDTVAVRALDRATRIHPVLQAQLPDLRNASRLLEAFRALGYGPDKVQPVLNRYDRRDAIGLEQVRRVLGCEPLVALPNAWREVANAINHGEPVGGGQPGKGIAGQIASLVQHMLPTPAAASRAGFARLFGRA